VGLIGVAISFVLGCIIGGISGYFGGRADMIIQRVVEFLLCIPTIPLWMSLSAALPDDWSSFGLDWSGPGSKIKALSAQGRGFYYGRQICRSK